MMDILLKLGLIIFWFAVVVACGTAYLWAIIFAIDKGLLGETSSKAVYFLTFVVLAAIVFKLPLL
ncbi:hypothetical protein FEK48_13130 [Escherichia sp. E2593]|uniref:hypothetical protein n=1 Tax=unclassified Escherichia TaxID=2608889 RepID=UPI0010292B0D|nr:MULTISPECIES: hypothetical protein [unclassified Escherichia]RZN40392.1 hypothetical protein D9738_13210 [Escherichia sp. E10V5]TGC06822.1 hypothetical protein CRG93_18455 [Escherichia sp. E2593]TLI81896.1 hypothetical protein FEK48_13130 [Escherichia sp. E2593]